MNINKECLSLIPYKNKIFLKPILNTEKKLLAPITYRNSSILNEIDKIQFILSKIPDSNFMKLWLSNKLEEDKIIINAKINEGTYELLKRIKEIKKEKISSESIEIDSELSFSIINKRYFNKIERDNLNSKFIFDFNENETELDTKILKDNKINKLYAGCYVIIFNNKLYYYIGSSTNLKERIRTHTNNILNYIKGNNNDLNEMLKFYLTSLHKQGCEKDDFNFSIKIIYMNTHYLNLFKYIYPDYKLSKGEFIILSKITDFLIKILEKSLIFKFKPLLNIEKNVVFKHFEWNDEFLDFYSKNNKIAEYLKAKRYEIFIKIEKKKYSYYYILFLNKFLKVRYDKELEVSICISTLQDICSSYNLRYYEVLYNLNQYHHYKETILKNPLKIVEVK